MVKELLGIDSQLSRMTVGSQVLTFGYDASGTPLYVIWNGSKYFYTTNLQGDVVAIVSTNGNPVVYYTYDAWGNILSITGTRADNLGKYNPLRYRGYVYDQETGLYYLQSRYYDPQWGRFLNADAFIATGQSLLGNNMFAYCGNNPIDRKDSTGTAYVFLDEFMTEVDPDGPFDEAAIGSGGWGLGVNPSYYTAQSVQSYDWNWQNSGYNQNITPSWSIPQHTTGTSAPDKNVNPGGSYVKIGDNGKIYSYTQFDSEGRQLMRIDFQGRPHRGVLPHIHVYAYPERGGRIKSIYDLSWNQIG